MSKVCPDCNGSGWSSKRQGYTCPTCRGEGKVEVNDEDKINLPAKKDGETPNGSC